MYTSSLAQPVRHRRDRDVVEIVPGVHVKNSVTNGLLRGRLKIRRQFLDLGEPDLVGVAREAVLLGQEEHAVALVALAPVCGHQISGGHYDFHAGARMGTQGQFQYPDFASASLST